MTNDGRSSPSECSSRSRGVRYIGGRCGADSSCTSQASLQTRLFFQDDKDLGLYWMDVTAGDKPTPGKPERVAGFPKLDPERQTLVQMREAKLYLMVGVRDEEQGGYESGWVLIRTGVEEEAHGDHSHWIYTGPPQVVATQLDSQQGNPAHVYCYDDVFYVANDALGGFTRSILQRFVPIMMRQRSHDWRSFYEPAVGISQ